MTFKTMIPWTSRKKMVPIRSYRFEEPLFPSLYGDMGRLFNEMTRDFWGQVFLGEESELSAFSPNVDLVEDDRAYRVSVELPGMTEKDINLSLKEGTLTIRGEKKSEVKKEEDNVYRMECSYGSFQRNIPLRSEIDEEKIEATFDKGLLKITLPKSKEKEEETRHITIKAA